MKPIVGVLMRPIVSNTNRKIYGTYKEISDVILKHGAIPIQLFALDQNEYCKLSYKETMTMPESDIKDLHRIIDLCDGILLQGGSEFYPYDLETAKYTYEKDIPTLGICLGMQTMGVCIGGKLGSVEKLELHQNTLPYAHDIHIVDQTKLKDVLKKDQIYVNSRHKDCLIKTSLDVSAYSMDGVIEAVEDPAKSFYIGVQWHPESMLDYDISMADLFSKFIDQCYKYQKEKWKSHE